MGLIAEDPVMLLLGAIEQAKNYPPEERGAFIKRAAAGIPVSVLDAAAAHSDSPEGYIAFYTLIHGFPPPAHVVSEVKSVFKAHSEGKGYTLIGWRGSWKSVSLSVTFLAWRIGLEPRKTNVVISANDDSAEKITKSIAAMIEFHPGWKLAFPNIVPDTGRWSVEGFSVVNTSVSRQEWEQAQSGVIDPTLVGGGYTSTRINGKHPTGVLVVDDIHDLNNSSSERERKMVVKTMTTVILKTVIRKEDKLDTWFLNIGVPWAEDDSHHVLKNSGGHISQEIPAMKRCGDGEGIYIDGVNPVTGIIYEDIKGWWKLTEPERFGINSILQERALGKSEFWQMIMLDLATASTGQLKYMPYPHEQVQKDWPSGAGVDPTNVEKPAGEPGRRSSFAIAVGVKLPTGGGVVCDGLVQPCGLVEAIGHMRTFQTDYSGWQGSATENVGGGAMFIQGVRASAPDVMIFGSDLATLDERHRGMIKSKPDRILEVSNFFENGRWRISDADTPFLNALRKLFRNFYDLIGDPHNECWDVGDAVYHLVKSMPDVIQTPTYSIIQKRKEKRVGPLSNIGSYHGYG